MPKNTVATNSTRNPGLKASTTKIPKTGSTPYTPASSIDNKGSQNTGNLSKQNQNRSGG